MTARIEIDLNVRVRGGLTYAGFEDASGAVAAGDHVRVYERESGLEGPGEVVEVDAATKLIYLRVEWSELSAPWRADDQPFRLPALIGGACSSGSGEVGWLYLSSVTSTHPSG